MYLFKPIFCRWRTSDWSACITETINHCSGKPITGTARRTVECVLTSDNIVVDNEACEYFWNKPESEMACSVDCPQSCVTAKKNVTCRVQACSKIITEIEEVTMKFILFYFYLVILLREYGGV